MQTDGLISPDLSIRAAVARADCFLSGGHEHCPKKYALQFRGPSGRHSVEEIDMGPWIPLWIIGAPLVFALIDMFMTPKPVVR